MATKKKAAPSAREAAVRAKLQKSHGELGTFHVEELVGPNTGKLYREATSSKGADIYLSHLVDEGKKGRIVKISDEY